MIHVGIAGIGFMGWIHWLAYQSTPGMQVTAICTRDKRKLDGDWRKVQGNFGPPGQQVDLDGIARYDQMDQFLNDEQLDLIDICLPPHMHGPVAIQSFAAGKHVFCEKPMALTAASCDEMLVASRDARRQLAIGHVLPFFPEYRVARQMIDGGDYGRLLGGSFKRIISDPNWLADFFDPDRVGGPLVDLHVHDAHLIRLLFGMPTGLVSRGRMRGDVVEYCDTLFEFEDPSPVVSASSGVINQQGRAFTHGFEIHLEKASLQYEFAVVDGQPELLMPLTVYETDGRVTRPDVGDGDPLRAFEAEMSELAGSIEKSQPSSILSGELARDAITICHKQTESVTSRQAVRF